MTPIEKFFIIGALMIAFRGCEKISNKLISNCLSAIIPFLLFCAVME